LGLVFNREDAFGRRVRTHEPEQALSVWPEHDQIAGGFGFEFVQHGTPKKRVKSSAQDTPDFTSSNTQNARV
jgi:hypothetical protein